MIIVSSLESYADFIAIFQTMQWEIGEGVEVINRKKLQVIDTSVKKLDIVLFGFVVCCDAE